MLSYSVVENANGWRTGVVVVDGTKHQWALSKNTTDFWTLSDLINGTVKSTNRYDVAYAILKAAEKVFPGNENQVYEFLKLFKEAHHDPNFKLNTRKEPLKPGDETPKR